MFRKCLRLLRGLQPTALPAFFVALTGVLGSVASIQSIASWGTVGLALSIALPVLVVISSIPLLRRALKKTGSDEFVADAFSKARMTDLSVDTPSVQLNGLREALAPWVNDVLVVGPVNNTFFTHYSKDIRSLLARGGRLRIVRPSVPIGDTPDEPEAVLHTIRESQILTQLDQLAREFPQVDIRVASVPLPFASIASAGSARGTDRGRVWIMFLPTHKRRRATALTLAFANAFPPESGAYEVLRDELEIIWMQARPLTRVEA